jgi:thiamine kinase
MVKTLPEKQRLRLTWAVDQWSDWDSDPPLNSRPEFINVLNNGVSNHSFLVQSEKQLFVIRLDGNNILALNLNREQEWQAQSIAWRHKLAPRPIYQNTHQGVFVSEYIQQSPHEIEAEIKTTADLLLNIHKLPSSTFKLDIIERTRYYKRLAIVNKPDRKFDIEKIWLLFLPLAKKANELCTKSVLCHNDLLRANRLLYKNKLIAIDWEYAAMADPFFDLAVVIEGDHLSVDESGQLLNFYIGENNISQAEERLLLNRALYRAIDLLWHLATGIHPQFL